MRTSRAARRTIDPDVWPVTFNRPVEERLHLDVDLLA